MNSTRTTPIVLVALSIFLASAPTASAQSPAAPKTAAPKPATPPSVTVISPIFGQLVRFSMPPAFAPVSFEKTNGPSYIREAVLKGETVEAWTQMITVTGAKGVAGNPQVTPQSFAVSMAAGFKKACPDTFAVKPFGAVKFGDQDGFVAVVGCGRIETSRRQAWRDRADHRGEGQRRLLYDPVGGARAVLRGQTRDRRGEVAGSLEQAEADPVLPDRAGRSDAVSELRRQAAPQTHFPLAKNVKNRRVGKGALSRRAHQLILQPSLRGAERRSNPRSFARLWIASLRSQ